MKKKLLAICLLSALIFPMGIVTNAEEDTGQETSVVGVSKPSDVGDTATSSKDTEQTSEDGIPTTGTIEESKDGVSEVSNETSNTSEVSNDISTTSEASDEVSTVSEVSEHGVSEETSTEPETSEWEPPFEGEQDIYFTLNFGGHFGHSPYDYEDGYIDYSNVHFQVLTADKKMVLGDYQITEDMFDTPRGRSTTPVLTVRVPEWKDGVKYYVRVEGLPSIYTSSTQDIEMKCEKQKVYELSFPDGEPSKDKNGVVITPKPKQIDTGRYYYFGIDVVSALTITPQLKDFDTLCYVYDNDKNPISNMVLNVVGVNADDVVLLNQQIQVIDGIACIKVANDKVEKLKISSETVVNDKQLNGEFEFAYNYITASSYSPVICKLYVNKIATLSDDEKQGMTVNEYLVDFNLKYADKNDMLLFDKSQINISVYNGAILEREIILDEDGTQAYNVLEGKHTIKSVRNTDYDVTINPVTLDVKQGAKVDITATPRVTLTIVNEENGVKKQAHFKVSDKEFTDTEHKFSVNTGNYISVMNLDTGEDFTVYIGKYRDVTLNIATGNVDTAGEIDDNDSTNTSTSTNNKPNDTVTVVPKTGDIIFGVLLTLCGLTGLSYLGYLYFKKKGENSK